MYTEGEAKEKWCPFAVASDQKFQPSNRTHTGATVAACRCVASKCMAWQWGDFKTVEEEGEIKTKKSGFCGLARR